MKIAIVDYGIGNVKSMINAFDSLKTEVVLTSDPKNIMNSSALVLPGVGAFASGMNNLRKYDLIDTIHEFVNTGKPFLGVCLGMQMLLEESEEFGSTKGLGLIKGKVVKLKTDKANNERLPHVSWNEIKEPNPGRWKNTILENTTELTDVYFVHSYAAVPQESKDVLAIANYSNHDFCAAVSKNNVFGTQFHPEKSGVSGLNILKKFIDITKKNYE